METVLNKFLRLIIVLLFSVITLLAVLQITFRFFEIPITWADEIIRFMFIWFVMLGAAYAIREKQHVAVDFISEKISPKVSRVIAIITNLIMMTFIYVLIVNGYEVAEKMIQVSPANQIPMKYIFISIPISGVLMMLYTILNVIDLIRGKGDSV